MAPAPSKPIPRKVAAKTPPTTPPKRSRSSSNNTSTGTRSNSSNVSSGSYQNATATNSIGRNNPVSASASTSSSTVRSSHSNSTMNPVQAPGNANDELMEYLRANSAPLANNIRLAGSPRSATAGPRRAIIIVYILNMANGIHGFGYEFRREEEPEKGTYIEKIHRDQVRGRDTYLLGSPLNVLKTTFGRHSNGRPMLNDKGYELSVFFAIQNFQGKTEATIRQLARFFATAIKQHIERDPNCQNQEIVVNDNNIHYNEDTVFMDLIGERNAVNLYRTILPVDSTPGYSQFNGGHARSFFREGTLSPESVALIKGDSTFLAPEHRNGNDERNERAAQNGQEETANGRAADEA